MTAADDFTLPREAAVTPVVPDDTTWRTLELFCGYRIVLAVVVGIAFGFFDANIILGAHVPGVILPTVILYTCASIMLLAPARLRDPRIMRMNSSRLDKAQR